MRLTPQIWKHIGLELRANHTSRVQPNYNRHHASYFLHHPDLSSAMLAPAEIPTAQFQGLRCEARYRLNPSKSPALGAMSANITTVERLRSPEHDPESSSTHTYGLRSNPRRSRKVTIAQEETNIALAGLSAASESSPGLVFSEHGEESLECSLTDGAVVDEMSCLLDFALRKIIGIKGTVPGLRVVKSAASPSLIDIAPAVWDLRYLQVRHHAETVTRSC